MVFRYRTANANCDNDVLGTKAVNAITVTIQNDNLDFFVINCQELDFNNAKNQLINNLPPKYKIIQSDLMPTHTKSFTQGNQNYGMATLIVYNANTVVLSHKKGSSKIIRRSNNRLTGSSYNKGGLISNFEIQDRKQPVGSIKLQTISGHLESGAARNRSVDWRNINKGLAKEVADWDDLVTALPNLRLAGYDANTRNQLLSDNQILNPWKNPEKNAETQSLHQLPLGVSVFTADNTYNTSATTVKIETESARKGYVAAGSLDFCTVSSSQKVVPSIDFVNNKEKNDNSGFQISMEDSTKRDHDIVVSPIQQIAINISSDAQFQSCKAQIANALSVVAPNLATQIWTMSPNSEAQTDDKQLAADKTQLIKAYQLFLSPEGLLQQALNLQISRLKIFDTLKKGAALALPQDKQLVAEALFNPEPWFQDVTLETMAQAQAKFDVKKEATELVLHSLKDCVNAQSMLSRLAILQAPINNELTVDSYLGTQYTTRLNTFGTKLSALKDGDMKTQGMEILTQIKKEFNPDPAPNQSPPSHKQLIQLIEILDNCIDITTVIQSDNVDKKKSLQGPCGQLAILSQNLPGKSYSVAEKIAKALLIFACVALVVAGILAAIPSGGSSLLLTVAGAAGLSTVGLKITGGIVAGVAVMSSVATEGIAKAKTLNTEGLRKSILEYKNAVNKIKTEEDVEVVKSNDDFNLNKTN